MLFSTTVTVAQFPDSNNVRDSSKHQLEQLLLNKKIKDTGFSRSLLDFCAKEVSQNPELCIEAAKKGAAFSRNWGQKDFYALFVNYRLKVLNNKGQYIDVVKLKDSLDNLSDLTVPEVNRLEWIAEFGKAYYKLGKIDKLVLLYKEGIEVARLSGMYTYEIQQLNNLAIAYNSIGQVQTAIIFVEEALQLSRQKKIPSEEARCLINLSHFETIRQNFGNSNQLLKSLLEKPDVAHNTSMTGLILSNMSWNYYQMQDYPNALVFCRQAMSIRREIQDSAGYARGIGILARIQLKLGAIDSARFNASLSLEMARRLRIISDVRDNYETLSGINEQTGNYKAALFDFRQFLYWKDSALRQERDAQLRSELLSLQYEELEIVKRAYKEQAKRGGLPSVLTWLFMAVQLIIIMYLFVLLIQEKKKVTKQVVNPDAKPEDRSTISSLDETDIPSGARPSEKEAFDLLRARVEELSLQLSLQQKQDLANLQRLLREVNLQDEHYWNEFLLLFSNVYPQFYEKLIKRYQGLTQNELRLAALIKLNVSMQDAANALNITPESVRKARYRLYKKLNLESDQELVELLITN